MNCGVETFLERLISVLRVWENATSRSLIGLEGSTSQSQEFEKMEHLGLVSVLKVDRLGLVSVLWTSLMIILLLNFLSLWFGGSPIIWANCWKWVGDSAEWVGFHPPSLYVFDFKLASVHHSCTCRIFGCVVMRPNAMQTRDLVAWCLHDLFLSDLQFLSVAL